MTCQLCLDSKSVTRFRACGTAIGRITCPACVRGISVLGTHEMLRPLNDFIPPGTILAGLVHCESVE